MKLPLGAWSPGARCECHPRATGASRGPPRGPAAWKHVQFHQPPQFSPSHMTGARDRCPLHTQASEAPPTFSRKSNPFSKQKAVSRLCRQTPHPLEQGGQPHRPSQATLHAGPLLMGTASPGHALTPALKRLDLLGNPRCCVGSKPVPTLMPSTQASPSPTPALSDVSLLLVSPRAVPTDLLCHKRALLAPVEPAMVMIFSVEHQRQRQPPPLMLSPRRCSPNPDSLQDKKRGSTQRFLSRKLYPRRDSMVCPSVLKTQLSKQSREQTATNY